jgi:hypothetical protein
VKNKYQPLFDFNFTFSLAVTSGTVIFLRSVLARALECHPAVLVFPNWEEELEAA